MIIVSPNIDVPSSVNIIIVNMLIVNVNQSIIVKPADATTVFEL